MKKPKTYTRFAGGISDFQREGLVADSFAFGRSVDVRSEPQNLGILPRTIKESGNVVTDLVKWSDAIPSTLDLYLYGDTGNLYKRTSSGSYSFLRQAANSHGNGLTYSAEDDFLYYTSDKTIGRYGPISAASPSFVDDFLGAQGGVPLNTFSLGLIAASSQYASRSDSASLSTIGDLSIEAQIKPTTLPTVGNSMTIVSKWDESGATRSYKFDIYAVSGVFGDGSDGAITVSSNSTYDNTFTKPLIDSACTGTSGSTVLSATNASFAAGQNILIHQTQGTGAGTYQKNSIQGYSAGTITLSTSLNATYSAGAQVIVLRQFSDVTINAGITLTAKAWNGTTGGIVAFLASGTVTINGALSASSCGFRSQVTSDNTAPNYAGEGTAGTAVRQTVSNGNGGGGGGYASSNNQAGSGAGGSNGSQGDDGLAGSGAGDTSPGIAGATTGTSDLTTMTFGGAGGSGGANVNGAPDTSGGTGGGIVYLTSTSLAVGGAGAITSQGQSVGNNTNANTGGSGAGAGGSILIKGQTVSIGTGQVIAPGGTTIPISGGGKQGGRGGAGRIHIDYLTSFSGVTSNPTFTATQDNSLVTTTTYQIRLYISNDGTSYDILTKNIGIQTGNWQQIGVSWASATKTATFFLNAVSRGSSVGTKTSISDNTSDFVVGAYINSSSVKTSFYDGLIDELRIWSIQRTATDFLAGINQQISTVSAGLQAYYKFNNDYTDSTPNANHLTPANAPLFSTNVPFSSPTTRTDIDQSAATAGNVYVLGTVVSEASVDRLVFTPLKDPQKSVAVNIASVGTGDWTLSIHDQYNNTIASKTVNHASLALGLFEFVFATPWRPLTNFTNNYHFHLTSTVPGGSVVTTTVQDLSTATYQTFFQFLVSDSDFHPISRFLNFVVFGNERHIAKYDATLYDPNFISLPAGWRIRCFAYWGEYLAIGVWKGSTITDFDSGRVYFWDGIQPTFNFYIDIPQGGINALFGSEGNLYIWAGYQGHILQYSGGQAATPIKRIPQIVESPDNRYVEIYPGAVTMWRKLLRFGVCGNSDSPDIQRGGYTWGRTNIYYPEILTFDYPISTGNLGSTVKVGMMTAIGRKLLMSWQDNVSYGIDYVDVSNPCYPTARVEFLINDDDMIWKQKRAVQVVVNTDPIVTGQTITQQYKIDNTSGWVTNVDPIVPGAIVSRQTIPAGTYNQIQVAVDLATTLATGPLINGVALEEEGNETSGRIG